MLSVRTMTRVVLSSALACFLGAASAIAADPVPANVANAVNDPGRSWNDVARDKLRHPAEVMAFTGLKPGGVAVDFMPEGGYYTRLLASLVGAKGRVYSYVPFLDLNDFQRPTGNALPGDINLDRRGGAVRDPDQNTPLNRVDLAYAIEHIPQYRNIATVLWESITQFGGQFGLPEQADLIFTGGDYHVLHSKEFATANMVGVNKAIFRALKPGGMYLIVDHAAKKGAGFKDADALHRVESDTVKAEVLSAGFTFDGELKIATNAADDHSKAADNYSMDPVDDFVLRFRKPINATGDKRPAKNAMDGFYGNTESLGYGLRGNASGLRERRVWYHADGTYQEFGAPNTGNNPWQTGTWFWNADGNNCMLHEFPANQRGEVVCHSVETFKKAGDKWTHGDDGQPGRPLVTDTILPGYVRF